MKIGILGGTFDPVHNAHLVLAEAAYQELSLDTVWLMPTGNSPHKKENEITPLSDRLNMLSLVVEENPHLTLSRFEVDSGEVNYTFRTAEQLTKLHPKDAFVFLMGGDSLLMFDNWVHPEIIARHFTLAATVRSIVDERKAAERIGYLKEKYEADIVFFPAPSFDISSTMIRERIKQEKSIRYLERVGLYLG